MPIKDRKIKLLLLLYTIASNINEYVEIIPQLQEIFDISMNQKTKGTLSSLVKAGSIDREEESHSYRLTEKGFYALCLEFPYFRFQKDEWDGLWRIISYEIPESKRHLRDRLRREMRGWGLGPWHRSFWLTPHPIISNLRDVVFGREEEQYIEAFEATQVFGDIETLVEKVWGRSALDKGYRELFRMWHTILSEDKDNVEKFKHILYSYLKFIREDPGLPAGLLGRGWIGFEAATIFSEIKSILLK